MSAVKALTVGDGGGGGEEGSGSDSDGGDDGCCCGGESNTTNNRRSRNRKRQAPITVCATIHSPTPFAYSLFDSLVLLIGEWRERVSRRREREKTNFSTPPPHQKKKLKIPLPLPKTSNFHETARRPRRLLRHHRGRRAHSLLPAGTDDADRLLGGRRRGRREPLAQPSEVRLWRRRSGLGRPGALFRRCSSLPRQRRLQRRRRRQPAEDPPFALRAGVASRGRRGGGQEAGGGGGPRFGLQELPGRRRRRRGRVLLLSRSSSAFFFGFGGGPRGFALVLGEASRRLFSHGGAGSCARCFLCAPRPF